MIWRPSTNPLINRIYVLTNRYILSRDLTWVVSDKSMNRWRSIMTGHGTLVVAKHADHGDHLSIAELSGRLGVRPYYMAAAEIFDEWCGLLGLGVSLVGAFPVQRGGNEIEATRFVVQKILNDETVALFPEGEVHFLNDIVTPLKRGMSLFALEGARARRKAGKPDSTVILPIGFKYAYPYDISGFLDKKMALCEKAFFGRASHGDVTARLGVLLNATLDKTERRFQVSLGGRRWDERFTSLAHQLSERLNCEDGPVAHEKLFERAHRQRRACKGDSEASEMARWALRALDFWPGYLDHPTPERLLDTLRKTERLLTGNERPAVPGRRLLLVEIADPIYVDSYLPAYMERRNRRRAMDSLTCRVAGSIQGALDTLGSRAGCAEAVGRS